MTRNSEKSRKLLTSTYQRLMERKNDRDKETGMPSVQAQVKAVTRWGTDPVTIRLSEIHQTVMIVQGSNDERWIVARHWSYLNRFLMRFFFIIQILRMALSFNTRRCLLTRLISF